MENEKKSSRLGVRLSAVIFAVLFVACMAVPAFAYDSTDLVGEWVFPEHLDFSLLQSSDKSVVGFLGYIKCDVDGIETSFRGLYFRVGGTISARLEGATEINLYENGQWVNEDYRFINIVRVSSSVDVPPLFYDIFFANAAPPPPPPPDPMRPFNSGLTIVLDWVGATVSALFSGELAGLLPLVAVPVAITLLLVAIIVIKRSIWGA